METNAFHREFHHACVVGDMPKIHEAIATGRLTVEDLNTGLENATLMLHADAVATLFDAGARVTERATNRLHGKDFHQDPRIVRLFLDNGLDPNARTSSGETLLRTIVNPSAAAVLLSAGADPNLPGPRGIPPLGGVILSTQEPDTTSILELYLEHGAKLESNLLFYSLAPRVQQRELKTRFLLDKGVDPNATSDEWGTPLHLAARLGNVEIVKMLLEAGADPTVLSVGKKIGTKTKKTPAQVAEYARDPQAREAILSLFRGYSR
ncbi:uncharacterized protein N7515_009028 [Penicillium bovifimosum]|uniref:Uncharacterized protein n=1 Tax=Penicillium bovifimosum TaxID=126998 RepID=A0A9W9GIH5_9EURO|nr:uncharacterized protein N7515_009028 [Penicillium bovifimosum]KAJ5121067.1 hypothetical protein N7515_009028 [Penicillium bovifimosum]